MIRAAALLLYCSIVVTDHGAKNRPGARGMVHRAHLRNAVIRDHREFVPCVLYQLHVSRHFRRPDLHLHHQVAVRRHCPSLLSFGPRQQVPWSSLAWSSLACWSLVGRAKGGVGVLLHVRRRYLSRALPIGGVDHAVYSSSRCQCSMSGGSSVVSRK